MEYELAKELKDNNFKTPRGIWFAEKMEYLPAPTLSELIEDCGIEVNLSGYKDKWDCNFGFEGKTPEDAVARLWLVINKK